MNENKTYLEIIDEIDKEIFPLDIHLLETPEKRKIAAERLVSYLRKTLPERHDPEADKNLDKLEDDINYGSRGISPIDEILGINRRYIIPFLKEYIFKYASFGKQDEIAKRRGRDLITPFGKSIGSVEELKHRFSEEEITKFLMHLLDLNQYGGLKPDSGSICSYIMEHYALEGKVEGLEHALQSIYYNSNDFFGKTKMIDGHVASDSWKFNPEKFAQLSNEHIRDLVRAIQNYALPILEETIKRQVEEEQRAKSTNGLSYSERAEKERARWLQERLTKEGIADFTGLARQSIPKPQDLTSPDFVRTSKEEPIEKESTVQEDVQTSSPAIDTQLDDLIKMIQILKEKKAELYEISRKKEEVAREIEEITKKIETETNKIRM